MKQYLTLLFMTSLLLTVLPLSAHADAPKAAPPKMIRPAPPAPSVSDTERWNELARRRAEVGKKMADKSIMILYSAEPKLYAYDVNYVYRQENNLYYLTGLKQENATLVLVKDGDSLQEFLFLPKRNPQYEAWNGKMYSGEEAMNVSGLKTLIDARERDAFLKSVKEKTAFTSKAGTSIPSGFENIYMLLPGSERDRLGKKEFRNEFDWVKEIATVSTDEKTREFKYTSPAGYKVQNAQPIFAELRHIKSPYELKLLQHAIDITTEAQMRSMAVVGRAKWEYEVHAEVEYVFRRRNADFWGYPSIVGCGGNATTLHYVESQGQVRQGDLLLMDVGAEYDHYTADVTRTYPVNGKFSREQAEIYRIVFDAQEAVAKATRPGALMKDIEAASGQAVAQGLAKLGLITAPDATYEIKAPDGKIIQRPQYKLWFIHGNSHWLGMNVHDVGDYEAPLKAGMTFTNEPGIYLREDSLDYLDDTPANKALLEKIRPVYERYKNIGVRIEDDMLVTPTGVEWMTIKLPRKLEDMEAFMARAPKEVPFSAALFTNRPENIFVELADGSTRWGVAANKHSTYHQHSTGE
jgi:Xaa-Pro aminopeptidase